MTVVRPERPKHSDFSGGDLRGVSFAPARGFGKGYDTAQVDAFIQECAALVDRIESNHRSLLAQVRGHDEEDLKELVLQRSRETVAAAEKAGESIVARAQEVSEELRAKALHIRADALAAAETLIREARVHSESLLAQARSRAAAMEDETAARLRELQRKADARAYRTERDADGAAAETRSQTAQLVILRDEIRVQMQGFLADMLQRVAENQANSGARPFDDVERYRLDHPIRRVASDRSVGGLGKPSAFKRRHRRPYRVAGQSVVGHHDEQLLPASRRGD